MESAPELTRLALALAEARDHLAIHRALSAFVRATTPASGLFVSHYDEATKLRTCVHAETGGVEVDVSKLPPLPLTTSPHSRAVETGEVQAVEDFDAALGSSPRVDIIEDDPDLPQSTLVVPIVARGKVLGAFEIQASRSGVFGERDVAALRLAASLVGLAVENVSIIDRERREQAVSRGLARRLVKGLARRGSVPPVVLREMGRELAAGLSARTLDAYVRAFSHMGLGTLRHARSDGRRSVFTGEDLLEREERSTQPTCALALGFLEGAMASCAGAPCLGTEVRCQSMGHDACEFIVAVRSASL